MKRKALWMIAAVSAGLLPGIAGCGKEEQETITSMKIGVTLYDQYDTFISEMMDQFMEYTVEKEMETGVAVNVEVYNAANAQSVQNEQVETMLQDGCDVICVNLVDRTDPTAIIDRAEKSGVPVIFFNRELVEEDLERWDGLYYVGAEALVSGILEGEAAAQAFLSEPAYDKNQDGKCQYVVLEGEAGHQDAIVRTEYSVRTVTENGVDLEKLGYAIANWNRAQAQTKVTQMLAQYGNGIEMIISNNDDMALGAIDALEAEGIPWNDWPVIVGIDGTSVGLEAVKSGKMQGTVYNDKEGQAKGMLELCYALVTGEGMEALPLLDDKYIRLPYSKVTQDDVDVYIYEEK